MILRGGAILWNGLECKGQGPGLLSMGAEEDGYPSLEMGVNFPFLYCSIPVVLNQKDQDHLGGVVTD